MSERERVSLLQRGEGEDLVLLHGYLACKESFYYQIEALSARYRVTAFDFWGMGASAPPDGPWSVSDYAARTRALLGELGIARAFLARPDVVFADEPTGNLDSKTTVEVMEMICGFARDFHQTIILVTHDPEMARYADRIVTLIDGQIVREEVKQRSVQ